MSDADPRTYRPWEATLAAAVIAPLVKLPGATLPVLHALQETFGYIHPEAIPIVAEALNLSKAEIVGVVNFYHDFRQSPAPRHDLQVCRAEACQSMGSDALTRQFEERLAVRLGEETPDGEVALRAVYCLGNCALSPAVMLNGRLHGRVTPARADQLLSSVRP